MKMNTTRARLLATTVIAGTAALVISATPAAAQTDAAPAAAAPAPVQEIVVTGSLLRRTTTETPSPVTVLSAQDLANKGITTIADAVRSISADNSGTIPTAFSNGFASGSSGVALRGLTVNSTLVLIDGLRASNYPLADDGQRGFVDLNTIPFSIVDRVEVLKDGASSTYGADAIGGVVNLIMKPTFQGAEGDAEIGDSEHGGGFSQRYDFTVGHGDLDTDRYNAYFNFEFQRDDRILTSQRGFPFDTADLSSIGGANNQAGQPSHNSGSIYGSVAAADPSSGLLTGTPLLDANGNPSLYQPLRACGTKAKSVTDSTGTYCEQNLLAQYYDIQPEQTRFGATARFTVQIDPNTQAYFMGSYYQNQVVVDQGPAGLQTSSPVNTNAITLPATLSGDGGILNPNDPFAAQGDPALINYSFGDIPSLLTETNHVFRGVLGLKGSFDGWDYKASLDLNHSSLDTRDTGYILYSQLVTDINNGAYSFINPASNSAAVRNALAPPIAKTSTTDLDSLDVSATHDLFELPGGPASIAVGGQFRYEAANDPDLDPMGAWQGLGVAHTVGNRTVGGIFFEANAPVLKQLEIDASGRFDHYSDFGDNFSPKIGFKFTPIKQIAFRGTYSQGFRAPSFSENGSSASEGFVNYQASSSAPAAFLNAHNNDAYTSAQYSLAEYVVANPHIKPETSESFTLGTIIQPIKPVSFTVDYYHIRKNGVIAQSDPGQILKDYYAGTPLPAGASVTSDVPDPLAPNALARPLVVEAPYVNANALSTDGIDFDLTVKFKLPEGIHWTSDLSYTRILTYKFTSGGETFNYVGTQAPYILSSGAGTPQDRGTWTNSFTYGPATVSGTLNYVSGIRETGADATGDPTVCLYDGANGAFPNDCRVKAYYDFDLTGSYQVTPKIEIFANILNLFDALPPLDPADYAGGGASPNYNPTYAQSGIVGRFFKMGIHVRY